MSRPRLTLLAGPNGVGKSTLAHALFPDAIADGRFLNADDMASGLRPNGVGAAAFRAGRSLLTRRAALIERRQSFILETTLATRTLLRAIEKARRGGFTIELTYLWVFDPDLCIQRIAHRVSRGGHFVPPDDVKRRHASGRELLPVYLRAVDEARIFNAEGLPALIAKKIASGSVVHDSAKWATLMRI